MRRLPLLLLLLAAGCATTGGGEAVEASARDRKGQGTRRVLDCPEKLIREDIAAAWNKADMEVDEEADAVYATLKKTNFAYALFFYPAPAKDKSDVEILIVSRWLKPAQAKEHEVKFLDGLAKGVAEKKPAEGWKIEAAATKPKPSGPLPSPGSEPAPKPTKAFDSQL